MKGKDGIFVEWNKALFSHDLDIVNRAVQSGEIPPEVIDRAREIYGSIGSIEKPQNSYLDALRIASIEREEKVFYELYQGNF